MLARGISMDKRAKTRTQPVLLALAFLAIYFVWGSTYLAIRYAVEGIPPLLVAGTRHLIAGTILCAWAWWRGERPAPAQWRAALVLGVLFFLVSHGALHWSERFVPSGLAAVLIAIEPVLIAYCNLRDRASGARDGRGSVSRLG
jgi:drug/metabolite transporter (DMT)-like permease